MTTARHLALLLVAAAVAMTALGVAFVPSAARAQSGGQAPDPEAILSRFVVRGDDKTKEKPLPKIGVVPSLASNIEDVTIHSVVRRDLDLCGEFEVIPDSKAPEGLYLSDSPVDVAAWQKVGAEAVVKVSGRKLNNGNIELKGIAYFTNSGDAPVFDKKFEVNASRVRFESHRVADALIGALTGTNGSFTSQMTFIYGTGKQRRVYLMDADGHEPRAISPENHVALMPVFGPNQKLHWLASINKDAYKVFTTDSNKPINFQPRGSVYGLAFSRDRSKVAAASARGPHIQLFSGPDLLHLKPTGNNNTVLHPAWSPNGKLAYSGAGRFGQRIHVDGKAISPDGLHATSPTFCRHPEGVRLVYMVGVNKNMDIVVTGENGGGLHRLTQGQGRNTYPACSPDGRLIAFFSTRKGGEGPGLYVMRIDGRRPKRISTLVGDSLNWARVPEAGKSGD